MTQVVLIRPGATVYDEQNRVQGILDIPLSDRGRAEVAQLAEKLAEPLNGNSNGIGESRNNRDGHAPGHELTALYCGPGESVVRTAETIGKAIGLRPKRIDDLRNLDQGLWQGLQRDEIKRRNLKVFRQWLEDPVTVCPPQGETVENALERIKAALRPLIRRHQDETIGLVVGEPLAQLIACYLRREDRVQLEDRVPTGGFELIEINHELGRNGS
jgi:broad specificity phosphatase PhoE